MIYFTSDTHFGHQNIAGKNVSRWKDGYRQYESTETMNQALVKSFNQTVKPGDTVYHLGDWSFGGVENVLRFRKQLNCDSIHLILGNHDEHIEYNDIIPSVGVKAQECFTSVSHYKEIVIGGQRYILFHYGMSTWHWAEKGAIHLYAHSHDMLPSIGKSMDVGVDVALRLFKTPRPFSVTEIREIMDKRENHK